MPGDDFVRAVAALMGEVNGLRLCDFGCGQGRVARYLADQGAEVVGVDVSAAMLEIARRYEAAERRLTGRHAERRPVWTEVPAGLVVRCRAAPSVALTGGIA
jgi:cyclopropane fatty-acyl-phospholipid synthase-like methyltransferase